MAEGSLLHLVIPGLLGPFPPEFRNDERLQFRLPALECMMARGRSEPLPSQDWLGKLGGLFQISPGEFPAGAIGWLGEGNDPGTSHWMRADPVHLLPDNDQSMLFDASSLDLGMEEAQQLVDACNRLLHEDGIELLAAAPERWYLRSDKPIRLHTTALSAAAGRPLRQHMPTGDEAGPWLGLMTELQMLLHQMPQNERREAAGELTINSVWFWGAGSLPASAGGGWQTVYADEPIAQGLAQLAGIAPQPVPKNSMPPPGEKRALMLLTSFADALLAGELGRWRQGLERLEDRVLSPSLQHLQAGTLSTLIIETEHARITLNRRDLRRFWRRPRPLRHSLEY
jgi:hypothetical protein